MTDDDLLSALYKIGMAAFVNHLALFEAATDPASAAERLQLKTGWAATACRTRVNYARAILAANRKRDALVLVSKARKVTPAAREQARHLLSA